MNKVFTTYHVDRTSDGYWRVFQTRWVAEGPERVCDLLTEEAARQYAEVLSRRAAKEALNKKIQFPEMPLNPASCPYHCRDSSGPYCTKNGTENRAVCTLETHNEYCEEPRRRMSQTPPESCAHVVRGDRGEWCCGITSLYTVCSVLCGHYRRKT